MPLFKLVAGKHQEPGVDGPVDYVAGDVVESDRDLDKVFKNKFIRLMTDGSVPKQVSVKAIEAITIDHEDNVGLPEENEAD